MTVLIVERDLGFAFWLGRALDERGYSSLPARDVRSAISLIRELDLAVDLLIIDAGLPGASSLVSMMKGAGSRAKVIFVDSKRVSNALPADEYLGRPGQPPQRQEFLERIEGLTGRAAVEI